MCLRKSFPKKYNLLKLFLDEKRKLLFVAAEALSFGNISLVFHAMDISEETIKKGCNELESGKSLLDDMICALGGGRKKSIEKDPTLLADLETLIKLTSRGGS